MLDRLRLGGFSGTYKLQNAELAQERKHQLTFAVTVVFLDDTINTFHVNKRAKGNALLQQVFDLLELSERDYFGLQFTQQSDGVIRWLNPNKSFKKQWNKINEGGGGGGAAGGVVGGDKSVGKAGVKSGDYPHFRFRVKFYVADPSRLLEEYTRYHFYLQVKQDIFNGKLQCPFVTACLLASYTVQSELGDYNPIEHINGYLSSMQLLIEQTDEDERRISELHKLHRGQLPADAEYNYLEHAKKLFMYGVDLHSATDNTGKHIQLGVTSTGLVVFQNNIRVNMFSWSKIIKLSFKRKDFFIHLKREPSENYDTQLGFGMKSYKNSKALWKSCVEHHSFFRLERPNRLSRFLPISLGSRFYYSGRTELQTVQESKQRGQTLKVFTRSPSKRFLSPRQQQQQQQQYSDGNSNNGSNNNNSNNNKSQTSSLLTITRSYRDKVTSKQSQSLPKKAWESQSDDEGNFYNRCVTKTYSDKQSLRPVSDCIIPTTVVNHEHINNDAVLLNCNGIDIDIATDNDNNNLQAQQQYEESFVVIKLMADEQGRFGFNIRGGIDLKFPILVSRIAPHTPADSTTPRICEGDQVIKINGHDVSELTHAEAVTLIRTSKDYHSGELILTIKQNALTEFPEDEPLFKYVPENESEFPSLHGNDDLFSQSLLLLSDGLASGALLTQYDKLYRKNSNLVISEAKKTENLNKNRYRDISPYDCTRVILKAAATGDYINANYVNMELPNGVINRYIATQGPLETTTGDFWRMVQQENSHLVVMLTTVMERGRPKCHQYWPVAGDIDQLSPTFSIRCISEVADETGSFVFRELQLCDTITNEKRPIHHMQYLAWPDHGVPSDPNLFIEFTERVRTARAHSPELDDSLKNFTFLLDVDADPTTQTITTTTNTNGLCEMSKNDDGHHKNMKNSGDDDDDGDENDKDSIDAGGGGGGDDDRRNRRRHQEHQMESPEDELPTSVHQCMSASNPPIIVHCSAGIGRTGVLILMDTALALIEQKEPVYPLDIVRGMRDQRACMVQNVSQYRFVCECICTAFAKLCPKEN